MRQVLAGLIVVMLSGCSPVKCIDGVTYVNVNPFGVGNVYQKVYTECKVIN